MGLPWNAALGGATSQVTDQVGAVVPGLVASAVLLGLFGLGFGTLVKNQVAAILLTIGGTLILEGILEVLARAIFHYDLNWLPNAAGAALAGDIARGLGGGGGGNGQSTGLRLLTWWQGGLVMLGWGLVPLTIGYFTTFRRDVTVAAVNRRRRRPRAPGRSRCRRSASTRPRLRQRSARVRPARLRPAPRG